MVSYTTVSPLPLRAVYFLLHCPSDYSGWALPTIVLFGARTFLDNVATVWLTHLAKAYLVGRCWQELIANTSAKLGPKYRTTEMEAGANCKVQLSELGPDSACRRIARSGIM